MGNGLRPQKARKKKTSQWLRQVDRTVKRVVLWILLADALVTAFLLYRSYASRHQLNIAPNAEREIEKAKGR